MVGTSLFLPPGSLLLSSAMAPLVAKFLHTDAPCCLRSWLHFLVCFWLHPLLPSPSTTSQGEIRHLSKLSLGYFLVSYTDLQRPRLYNKGKGTLTKACVGVSHSALPWEYYLLPSTKKFLALIIVTSPNSFPKKRPLCHDFHSPHCPPGAMVQSGDGGLLNGQAWAWRTTDRLCIV